MKYAFICSLIVLASCKGSQSSDDLSGVYTVSYEHEFGKTNDTLNVSKSNSTGSIYQIERHSGLIKKMDGKEFPKEIVTETWTLEYDPEKQTLNELKKGKTLVWNSGTQSLQLGDRQYLRIASK
jgi:hypothetical protein